MPMAVPIRSTGAISNHMIHRLAAGVAPEKTTYLSMSSPSGRISTCEKNQRTLRHLLLGLNDE